jgi:hypothetical protein
MVAVLTDKKATMSIRKFIFCDICNPQALRSIEFRRSSRKNGRSGRRISDGRAWIEGELAHAIKNGWSSTSDGQHVCPTCQTINKQI